MRTVVTAKLLLKLGKERKRGVARNKPTNNVSSQKGSGKIKVTSKFHPRTGHEGPEGEKKYSSTLSLTSVLDGLGGQRHALAALPPGERPSNPWQILGLINDFFSIKR